MYIKSFIPLLLSHHPQCEKFKNHTLKVRNSKLCIGCFIGYPVAIISLILIGVLKLDLIIPSQYLFLFGIVFVGTFILSPLNLIKTKSLKIIQKTLIGVGSVLIFYGILHIPNPMNANLYIGIIVLTLLFTVFNAYHVLGNFRKCYKCETPFDWNQCGGFDAVIKRMEKYNLRNIFENMDLLRLKRKREEKN